MQKKIKKKFNIRFTPIFKNISPTAPILIVFIIDEMNYNTVVIFGGTNLRANFIV